MLKNSNLNSKAKFSPLFYSTGVIKAKNCTGNTKNSQIGIIEGSSFLFLNNNDFKKYNDIIFANKTLRNLQINHNPDSDVAVKIGDNKIETKNKVKLTREEKKIRVNFMKFAVCFTPNGLANFESIFYSYDLKNFDYCVKTYIDDSLFDKYTSCMLDNIFHHRYCKDLLPDYLREVDSPRET